MRIYMPAEDEMVVEKSGTKLDDTEKSRPKRVYSESEVLKLLETLQKQIDIDTAE